MIEGWTAVRIDGGLTVSGNPLRGWIVTAHYAPVGTVFVEDGQEGWNALARVLNLPRETARRIASEAIRTTIRVTPKEYRALAREHVLGANSAEFRRSVRETVV